ncbi:MAG TPA: transporter substrate-binding domain-containing protein [Candidatus Limnocylindrales bacterium]|jgi:cystine transport system substrate-binding protein
MTSHSRPHRRSAGWIPALFVLAVISSACQSGQGASASAGSSADGGGDELLSRVRAAGVLRVANPQTSPPYSFRDEANEVMGFDVDFANEVGERIDIDIEFIQGTFDTFIPGLDTDRWDVVIAGQAITDERKEQVDFSHPYRVSMVTIFLNCEDTAEVHDLPDLEGRSIAVLAGSSDVARAESVPDAELKTYENATLALTDLDLGRVDSYIGSRFVGTYVAEKSGLNVCATDAALTLEQNAMSFSKGQAAFKAEMDRLVVEMIDDGTIAELSTRWFGPDEDVSDDLREIIGE